MVFSSTMFGISLAQDTELCRLIEPLSLNVTSIKRALKSSLSSHLRRNHSQNCSRLSGSSSLSAWTSLGILSIFELAKFDGHWISRYQSHKNIASMTSLGIVQKPPSTLLLLVELLSSTPTFQHICTVPSTSNFVSDYCFIVALVDGGVPNATLQRR